MIITPVDYVRNVFINGIVAPVHAHQVSLLLITYASVGKLATIVHNSTVAT